MEELKSFGVNFLTMTPPIRFRKFGDSYFAEEAIDYEGCHVWKFGPCEELTREEFIECMVQCRFNELEGVWYPDAFIGKWHPNDEERMELSKEYVKRLFQR